MNVIQKYIKKYKTKGVCMCVCMCLCVCVCVCVSMCVGGQVEEGGGCYDYIILAEVFSIPDIHPELV